MKGKSVYVLRTCNEDLTSYNGFQWLSHGYVEAPDWDPASVCGKGLHGLLWGFGNGDLLDWRPEAKWLVVRVEEPVVELVGKAKFRAGYVEHCGDRKSATDFIIEKGADPANVVGATVAVVDNQTAAAGDYGTATAGDCGTATAGDCGTAIAGYRGTATAGYRGTATAGKVGRISIDYWDDEEDRYRSKTGYIGEDGLKPDTLYRLNNDNEFVPA